MKKFSGAFLRRPFYKHNKNNSKKFKAKKIGPITHTRRAEHEYAKVTTIWAIITISHFPMLQQLARV